MNVIFCHDHVFLINGSSGYSYGSYPKEYWDRYLAFVDHVHIIARARGSSNELGDKYVLSFSGDTRESVSFYGVDRVPFSFRVGYPIGKTLQVIREQVKAADAVVCRIPSDLGWAVAMECRRQNKPYAVEVVGDAFAAYYYRGTFFGKVYALYSEWKMKFMVRHASASLYVSSVLEKKYPASPKSATVYATNAVINECSPMSWIDDRLQRLNSENYIPRVGLIGSYHVNYKGLDMALKLLADCVNSEQPFHLHVLGEGNAIPYLSLAKDLKVERYFHLDGLVPSGEPVRNWLRLCDYYIQPSRQEGLPRGLLEAISTGLPSVGSTAGGIAEVLPSQFVHKVDDLEELKQVFSHMLEVDYKQTSLQFSRIAAGYTFETVNARRSEFYKNFFKGNV